LKLYNSGSFFDRGAIPRKDWNEIIELCRPFEHLIVECHPKLVGPGILDFAARLEGQLEIAMGLETAHPEALEKLNKRITVEEFRDAARFLQQNGIAVRAFLLVGVPFIRESEQQCWMKCSIDIAFDSDAEVVSLIPTRNGNGAMDALAVSGDFREPALAEVEEALEYGVALGRGRVFADTWELARFSRCAGCADARRQRIERMNLHQRIESRIQCPCEG
jgi:radical SAM enzyme (TIGR01210 family)